MMYRLCTFIFFISSCYGQMALSATHNSKFDYNRVRSGDTIYSILKKSGFSRAERNKALAARILPKSYVLAPGDLYRTIKNGAKKIEVQFFDSISPSAYAFWKSPKDIGAKKKKLDLEIKPVTKKGKVVGSLVGSIRAKTKDDQLGYRFMDAYLLDYNVTKILQRGADFSITYEKLYDGDRFIRNGRVLKTELEVQGKKEKRKFVATKKGGVFVGSKNHEQRPFYAPVNEIRISSLYQARRYHPIKKYRKAHLGVDFELPEGRAVLSVGNGKILRFGRTRGAGRYVVIGHNGGYESYYNHMSKLSSNLRKGASVKAGQKIGEIGCTGYCTKPHLHFAMKKSGRFFNPIRLLRAHAYGQKKAVRLAQK